MIKSIRTICLIPILVLLFVSGLYFLIPYFPGLVRNWMAQLFSYILNWEIGYVIIAIVMLLLPLLYIILTLRVSSKKEKYVIRGKDGDSLIQEGAIVKSLVSAVRTVPTVVKVKPVIKNERAGLRVNLETHIRLEQFVPNICERVRRRARSTLTEVLGIDRISRIDVNIQEVKLPHPPLAERIKKETGERAGQKAPVEKSKTTPKPSTPPIKPSEPTPKSGPAEKHFDKGKTSSPPSPFDLDGFDKKGPSTP